MYFNDAFLPNFVVDTQKSEKITPQFVTFFIDPGCGPCIIKGGIETPFPELKTGGINMFEFLIKKLKAHPRKIVFTEGTDPRILEASARLLSGTFLTPVLVGNPDEIAKAAEDAGFNIRGAEIIDPENYDGMDEMVDKMVELRKGKMTADECRAALKKSNYFGTMLVKMGKADCLLGGATYSTADTVRPALQLIKTKPGNKIVWSLEFGKATIAPIVLRMAPCSPAANFSSVIKLTVNDKVVALLNDSLPGLVGQGWYDFKDFETEPVEFSQGKVTIVMEMLQVYFVNVDCIVLGIPADVSVKVSEDAVKPEISEIKVVSTELVAGKEIEFSYTAKDNVTAEDKLVKVEKVYLNYNKEGQEEVACNSGKFTPAKAGRYTIVVTVTDEAGNTETGTRSLTVEESGTPVNPDSGNSGTGSNSGSSSSSGKKGSCIGSIDMGYVLFPIALALLSLVIIKKRKTGDR